MNRQGTFFDGFSGDIRTVFGWYGEQQWDRVRLVRPVDWTVLTGEGRYVEWEVERVATA